MVNVYPGDVRLLFVILPTQHANMLIIENHGSNCHNQNEAVQLLQPNQSPLKS